MNIVPEPGINIRNQRCNHSGFYHIIQVPHPKSISRITVRMACMFIIYVTNCGLLLKNCSCFFQRKHSSRPKKNLIFGTVNHENVKKSHFFPILIFILAFSGSGILLTAQNQVPRHPGLHSGRADSVLQTGNYTYVLLDREDGVQWVAIPGTEIDTGSVYYFGQGILMHDFRSKELHRSFGSVLLLEQLYPEPDDVANKGQQTHIARVKVSKEAVQIAPGKGDLTLRQIWEEGKDLTGKHITVRGKVTKYNEGIMRRNWIHIQDGTEYQGHFDLTVTCEECTVQIGDTVTLRGTLVAGKDFGYGYTYELLLEQAKIIGK
jgi:hypothetical protein